MIGVNVDELVKKGNKKTKKLHKTKIIYPGEEGAYERDIELKMWDHEFNKITVHRAAKKIKNCSYEKEESLESIFNWYGLFIS